MKIITMSATLDDLPIGAIIIPAFPATDHPESDRTWVRRIDGWRSTGAVYNRCVGDRMADYLPAVLLYDPREALSIGLAHCDCECRRCDFEARDRLVKAGVIGWLQTRSHMHLCPDCGDKRCPHAADHRLACTLAVVDGE